MHLSTGEEGVLNHTFVKRHLFDLLFEFNKGCFDPLHLSLSVHVLGKLIVSVVDLIELILHVFVEEV